MRPKTRRASRRICFVTGTRADFGLMGPVLQAIGRRRLRVVVTGMHLDHRRGRTIDRLRRENWRIDAVVDWSKSGRAAAVGRAFAVGRAISDLARVFGRLKPNIVLVTGDRVEAFAAAAAAHLCDIAVAHVHGGDRALGQMDDALRHAISKLAHVHFPATSQSAQRLVKMGEDRWRIHRFGSPGIDGIVKTAAGPSSIRRQFPDLKPRRYALLVLHPIDADESVEFRRAAMVAGALRKSGVERIVVIYPNNDPGAGGIVRCWEKLGRDRRFIVCRDLPRPVFLGLLRDAAMLVGNSSSGIIEAASFRTPVIDIGPRQHGRQRCQDVRNVPYRQSAIAAAAIRIWNAGRPHRGKHRNPYAGRNTGAAIAEVLKGLAIDRRLLRKIISY
jgi:UDP-N-acetylglucosamine 2-epimerase (non-hydrolysing)/GDP/UDP-N,N'-diacetylbacillosamine 2-epimerase (hydrolysing)